MHHPRIPVIPTAVAFFVTATWSRPNLPYPDNTPWHGKPIEVVGNAVDAAYRRLAADVPGVRGVNPVGAAFNRALASGVADANPFDGIDAGKFDLCTYDHYRASAFGDDVEALVVFGNVTGVDPQALGRNECSGFELGISSAQLAALQQVAHGALVAAGATPSTPGAIKPADRGSVRSRVAWALDCALPAPRIGRGSETHRARDHHTFSSCHLH